MAFRNLGGGCSDKSPVLPMVACGIALGIVARAAAGASPSTVAALTLLAAASALLLLPLARAPRLALVGVAAFLAGVLALDAALPGPGPRPSCHVARLPAVGRPVTMEAVVLAAPRRTSSGWRQLVRAVAGRRGAQRATRPLCGRVELHREASAEPLWPGQRLLARTVLRPALGGRNPGVRGPQLRLMAHRVARRGWVAPGDLLLLGRRAEPSWVERARGAIRRGIHRALAPGASRAVVAAMVLGDRGDLREVRGSFARAGLSHLLAVSGLHLSLVAFGAVAGLGLVLRWLLPWWPAGEPRRLAAACGIAAALGFTLLTGAAVSTARACTMACVFLAGPLLRRTSSSWQALSLAAVVLLCRGPLELFRPSFQLSFAAVLGVMLALRRVALPRRGVARIAATLLSTTAGAMLVSAPLAAHHFGVVSPAGLATNLVAVPLTGWLLLPLALAGAAIAPLWAPLGGTLLAGAGAAAGWLVAIGRWVGAQPWAAQELSPGWLGAAAGIAGGLALLVRSRRIRHAALCALVLALAVRGARQLLRPPFEVTFIDVGQGDSTLLRLPDGAAMLVDAGGQEDRRYDPGARRVLPLLRAVGVSRLDYVVASHPHADHVAGLAAVLDSAVEVGEVWSCWHGRRDRWQRALRRWAARRGVPVVRPHRVVRGGVTVEPIWPRGVGRHCADPRLSTNDNSVVLRVTFGRASLLLTGDIERRAERNLAATARPVTVLKVPHHGSRSSSSLRWLRRLRPRLAVISCGVANRFGMPHAVVLRRLRRLGVRTERVDRRGALVVALGRDGRFTVRAPYSPFW